jgi:hypothetical protein
MDALQGGGLLESYSWFLSCFGEPCAACEIRVGGRKMKQQFNEMMLLSRRGWDIVPIL